jgi:hypothetical protein
MSVYYSERFQRARRESLSHPAASAMLSILVRGVGCGEQSGLNRLAEGAYSENGDNRKKRLRC